MIGAYDAANLAEPFTSASFCHFLKRRAMKRRAMRFVPCQSRSERDNCGPRQIEHEEKLATVL